MNATGASRGDEIETVQRYFELFAVGALDPFLATMHPDVRFVPIAGDGGEHVGRDEVRRFIERARREGRRIEPHAYRFVQEGTRVVAIGSLRQRRFTELRERTVAWTFELRDGLIVSIVGSVSPTEALEAIGAEQGV